MARRLVDLIEKNMPFVQTMIKAGKFPLSVMNDYDIYLFYKTITYEPAQLKKYSIVASNFKVSTETVRRAVREMERTIL